MDPFRMTFSPLSMDWDWTGEVLYSYEWSEWDRIQLVIVVPDLDLFQMDCFEMSS